MPEKDGIETVKEILAIDPAAVIFTMTGKDGAEDHNEVARMLGARRGFRKPVAMNELVEAIRDTRDASNATDEDTLLPRRLAFPRGERTRAGQDQIPAD